VIMMRMMMITTTPLMNSSWGKWIIRLIFREIILHTNNTDEAMSSMIRVRS
jgi:uncharacterized membrane protein YhdT